VPKSLLPNSFTLRIHATLYRHSRQQWRGGGSALAESQQILRQPTKSLNSPQVRRSHRLGHKQGRRAAATLNPHGRSGPPCRDSSFLVPLASLDLTAGQEKPSHSMTAPYCILMFLYLNHHNVQEAFPAIRHSLPCRYRIQARRAGQSASATPTLGRIQCGTALQSWAGRRRLPGAMSRCRT
jgi:hypothetical protein